MSIQETVRRYLLFIFGVFVNSLGICLIIKATLGSSPISSIPYVFSLRYPVSFGTTTLLFNLLLILGQILILRRDFKQREWLQLPVALLLGVFIDLSMWLLAWVQPANYLFQLFTLLVGCVVLGLGVSLEVRANVVMLSGEAFVQAVTVRYRKEFGFVKVGFDSSLTLLACVISLVLFGSVEGVREGTVIAALVVGMFARYFTGKTLFLEAFLRGKADDAPVESLDSSARFVVTIAREYGSGGREIGRRVAADLGIPFYDKELITLVAVRRGLKPEYVAEKEQRAPSGNLKDLFCEDFTVPMEQGASSADALFVEQSRVIKELVQKGSCVIVGRCADYVLRDHPCRFSVFIHADRDSKFCRLVEQYGEQPKAAAEKLSWVDKARADHYKNYAGGVWQDARNYHLSLDSGLIGIDACCEWIEAAVTARLNAAR